MKKGNSKDGFGGLIELVARLRSADGCPWDREQTLPDLRAYLLEEAHEAAAAIDGEDWEHLQEELGDLLFQVAFVVRLAEEARAFTYDQVVDRIEAKMIARHPHVFGDERLSDQHAVRRAWARRKLSSAGPKDSLLSGVPASLPALTASYRMTQKAADVGFDWPDVESVRAKLEEEWEELRRELAADDGSEAVKSELGDLIFTVANLARKLEIDPEAALAATNRKFRRRFRRIEAKLAERGSSLGEASMEEMEALWQEAKASEIDETG